MVNRWIAVLVVLLLVVPVAVAADTSGSFSLDESAVEDFGVGLKRAGGIAQYPWAINKLWFQTIEYYDEISLIEIDFHIADMSGPTGITSGQTDFTLKDGGTTIGTGTVGLSKSTTTGYWKMTLDFDTWSVGDSTGEKTLSLDYSMSDGNVKKLSATYHYNGLYHGVSGNFAISPVVSTGHSLYALNSGEAVTVKVYHTKAWENQWSVEVVSDDSLCDVISITKEIGDRSFTSAVTIQTPRNIYEQGSSSSDFDLITIGRPIYISVTDIYSNEYQHILYGDDYCSFSGTVYDVTNAVPLGGATVVAKQNSLAVGQETDTTDENGAYSYIGVPLQESTVLTTAKTGYTSQDLTFAPPWSQDWVFDLYMWPDGMTWNGSAIGGIAYEQGSSQGVDNATVHLWNETYSTNVTANSVGYYLVDNLTAGTTYSVQASAADHTDSTVYTAETATDTFTQTDVALQGIYNLVVSIRNSETGNLLDNTTARLSLSDGQDATTTTGTHTFTVNWGTYTVTASADGYYAGSEYVAVDEDATVTVNLVQTSTSGAGAYYPPHNVRFHVQDEFGNPMSGLLITAVYQESSGPVEWLRELFGLPASVEVENTTLSGTTGVDGSITFSMVEVVQYQMTASDATIGLSHTFLLYPKEDQYTIRFTLGDNADLSLYPDYEVMAFDINETYVGLNVMYNDTLTSSTDSFTFVVAYGNKTPLYSAEISDQSLNVTYAVENIKGASYYWGFEAEHSIYGTISDMQGITLKGGTGRIVDLGLDESDAVWYIYLSMIVTGIIAALFSVSNVKMGVIMIPLCAGFFFFIGWLPAAMAGVLAAAFAFGVLIYMRKSEYKLRSGY
jgi:hypothetical protein